jgi:hypothetical protein
MLYDPVWLNLVLNLVSTKPVPPREWTLSYTRKKHSVEHIVGAY